MLALVVTALALTSAYVVIQGWVPRHQPVARRTRANGR